MRTTALILGLALFAPTFADAAPVTLNFDVVFDYTFYHATGAERTDPLSYRLTLSYDDGVTFEEYNTPDELARKTFGAPTLTFQGAGLTPPSNPFGDSTEFGLTEAETFDRTGSDPTGRVSLYTESRHVSSPSGRTANHWSQEMFLGAYKPVAGYDVEPDAAFLLAALQGGMPLRVQFSTVLFTTTDGFTNNFHPDSFFASGTATYVPPASVPEPTSMLLLGTGLLGLATRLRRRRR